MWIEAEGIRLFPVWPGRSPKGAWPRRRNACNSMEASPLTLPLFSGNFGKLFP